MKTCHYFQTRFKQVKASLGGLVIKNLAKITRKSNPIQDIKFFYLYIYIEHQVDYVFPTHTHTYEKSQTPKTLYYVLAFFFK